MCQFHKFFLEVSFYISIQILKIDHLIFRDYFLHTIIWYQVFLFNTKNSFIFTFQFNNNNLLAQSCMVSSISIQYE